MASDRNSIIPDCPRCGNTINLERWDTSMDEFTRAVAVVDGKTVSFQENCSACEAPIELFVKTPTHMEGTPDIWIEDRREN